MREVILISVPYTGTNFTAKLFTDRGFHRVNMNEPGPSGDLIRVAHCIKSTQIEPAMKHVERGCPLVLPCRHPFRVEESYTRKGDSGHIPIMIEAFETLINRFSPLTEFFMCVDSDRRESQLERMKWGLRVPFRTEWGVMHSQSTTWKMKLEEFTPSKEVIDLVDRHRDFFYRFYG